MREWIREIAINLSKINRNLERIADALEDSNNLERDDRGYKRRGE